MPWFKVDDGMHSHPKAITAGDAALGLWLRLGSWSARHLTDGVIPFEVARLMGSQKNLKKLLDVGLLDEHPSGYEFHDYLRYNPSRSDLESERVKTAERVAAYRERKGGNAVTPPVTNAVSNGSGTGAPTQPNPSTTSTNPSRASRSKPEPDGFAAFWLAYPRKTAKPAALRAYRTAMKDSDPAVILAAASRYATERHGQDKTYTAHPATWLNGRRWEDEAPKPRSVNEWENYTTFSDFDSKGRPTASARGAR